MLDSELVNQTHLSGNWRVIAANRWPSLMGVKLIRLGSLKRFATHFRNHWNARIFFRRGILCFFGSTGEALLRNWFLKDGYDLFSNFDWLFIEISRVGSYSGSSINFWAHYDFFNNSQPEGIKTADTDCDVVYEPNTRISGQWISPYNTLLYKRSSDSSDLKCRYTFQVRMPHHLSELMKTYIY